MLKIKKNDSAWVRIGKQMLQGGLIGAFVGGPLGFLVGYFGLEDGFKLPMDSILDMLSWLVYGLILVSLVAMVAYILSIRQKIVVYEEAEDEDQIDDLYRSLGKRLSYAQVFSGIGTVLSFVNILLTYKVFFGDERLEMFIPILPFACLVVAILGQMYLLALNNRLRGTKTTIMPTVKELKENVLQLDEAELQANYKMSFDIVMTLSGVILPAIYVLLFIVAIIFQKVELTAILITAGIHIYIMVMNFKMTKEYFK